MSKQHPPPPATQLFETDPVDAEHKIKTIRAAPSSFFKLPERLEKEGGMFVTVMTLEFMKQAHEETDQNELAVYAHRVLRGRSEEEINKFYIIVDYDESAAFRKHFQGDAVQTLIHGDFWSEATQLSFFRDHV